VLLQNAGALFVGQALGLVVPLLTVPYLARVLGPSGWGPVIAAQALGNWLVLILEFGFDLSGTRAVARARVAPEGMGQIVHGVQSAKFLLLVFVAVLPAMALGLVPFLRVDYSLVVWTVVFAIFRGFSPLWFFQGIERVQAAVAIDTATRLLAALGVFVFVHTVHDGWRVIALQALFAAISVVVLTRLLSRHVRLRMPEVRAGIATLRETRTIFACRASSGLYVTANALILSAFAAPAVVGFFGGAERIIRAAINLLQPLTQTFLPRISYLHATDHGSAELVIRRTMVGVGALGVVMGLCAVFGAPLLVHVLLGAGYADSIPVLRALGALPPLVAINTVLGIYWALPFGHDRTFLVSIVLAAITNLSLAAVLAPRYGALGMASAALGAEVVVALLLTTAYVRRRPATRAV
jgi:PST family polysaccharide transporter